MTRYIGPIDWLIKYLAGQQPTHADYLTDTSLFTVVDIHPQQRAWVGGPTPTDAIAKATL